jgi:hypothetical protein
MKHFHTSVLFFLLPFLVTSANKYTISDGLWNKAATWSPSGTPVAGDKIFINHQVTLDVNFSASDTIFVRGILNLNDNKILNLIAGTMIIVNNENYRGEIGTIGKNAKINGNFIYQKWVTRCDGYSTFGSPFDVKASDFDWYYCNKCMPGWSNIYFYNESTPGNFQYGYYDTTNKMPRGKGFFYWFKNYAGGKNFPRTISLQGSLDFSTPFNFKVSNTVSSGTLHDGYNLISNPFPGTIDWLSTEWTKRRISGSVSVWNSCTDSYSSFVGGIGVNGGSRYISSMQGFWVKASGNNPELKVSSGAMTTRKTDLLRSSVQNDSLKNILYLNFEGDEIAVRIDSNSSMAEDEEYDALKILTASSRIYSSIDSLDYAINTINTFDRPIYLKTKGAGTISFNGVTSFGSEYQIVLKDLTTKTEFIVTDGMAYVFMDTTQNVFNKRFEISFRKKINTGITDALAQASKITYNEEQITVSIPENLSNNATVLLTDLSGRIIYSAKENRAFYTLQKPGVPAVLVITNEFGRISKKIF